MWQKLFVPRFKCLTRNPSIYHTKNVKWISTLVAGEPSGPIVSTEIPGPRSRNMLADMKKIQVCNKKQYFHTY